MAGVALRQDKLAEALRLFGAVDRILEPTHRVLSPADEQVRHQDLVATRLRVEPQAFDAAFREGQAATVDDLEAMVRSEAAGGRKAVPE
jgi:DNA-binding FadR family transcriptional regulator